MNNNMVMTEETGDQRAPVTVEAQLGSIAEGIRQLASVFAKASRIWYNTYWDSDRIRTLKTVQIPFRMIPCLKYQRGALILWQRNIESELSLGMMKRATRSSRG